jgi:hypothetical protein
LPSPLLSYTFSSEPQLFLAMKRSTSSELNSLLRGERFRSEETQKKVTEQGEVSRERRERR